MDYILWGVPASTIFLFRRQRSTVEGDDGMTLEDMEVIDELVGG